MEYALERIKLRNNWTAGLSNMLNAEFKNWFLTKRIWTQILVWSIILFGLVVLAGEENFAVSQSIGLYSTFIGVFACIGVIVSAQGVIIRERRSGVTSWLLSKPVSRTSYIISKFAGNLSGYTIAMCLVPTLLTYTYLSFRTGELLPVRGLMGFMAIVVLYFSFYLSMTIMLGSFFRNRGAVAGIPIGVFFAESLFSGVLPELAPYFPSGLVVSEGSNSIAVDLFLNETIGFYGSIITTSSLTLLFFFIAIWRFNREEL